MKSIELSSKKSALRETTDQEKKKLRKFERFIGFRYSTVCECIALTIDQTSGADILFYKLMKWTLPLTAIVVHCAKTR